MVNRTKRADRRHLISVVRHPARRDGAIAIALFLLPWAALVLVRGHHLDVGTMVAVFFGLAAVCIGLPTLWLTWAAYRGSRRSGSPSLADVADQLAIAVGAQWEAEAHVRRLNDPYPLPVSWAAADASLTDTWDSLVKLATSGAGWPSPPLWGTWAAGSDGLAGESGELARVLSLVPTGRLVVLGEPGAGKTMLMVRLVLDMLGRRTSGGPVPFLTSVASWDPAVQDLRDWLSTQLLTDHPALASPPQEGMIAPTQADALLAVGLILPILDGLDEIPEQVRGSAIGRINDALRPGQQVVVTCRTQQYQDAVQPQQSIGVILRAAAAVQLRPLDADTVSGYLRDDAAGPAASARWDPVLAVLGTDAPAGQALTTPLLVGLARAIYNPRPGELAGTLRDPAELCSPVLADRSAVESLLFDAFIPAAYRHDPASRWKAQAAEKWLVFLARYLEYTVVSPDLAWWELPQAVSPFVLAGVTAAGAAVTAAAAYGVAAGVVNGVVYGIAAGSALGAIAAVALWLGVLGMVWMVPGTEQGGNSPIDLSSAASPSAVLARDRGAATAVVGVLTVAVGAVLGVLAGSVQVAVFGAVLGAVASGTFSTSVYPSPTYEIARIWLALRHRLPLQLMGFLADAHRRGVLRQAGAVYQFRHIELQHRLANRDVGKQEAVSSSAAAIAVDE